MNFRERRKIHFAQVVDKVGNERSVCIFGKYYFYFVHLEDRDQILKQLDSVIVVTVKRIKYKNEFRA